MKCTFIINVRYAVKYLSGLSWVILFPLGLSVVTLLVLLFPLKTFADSWTKADTIRESAWQAIHVLDFMQTRQIARHPELFSERNPLLGTHPSEGKVIVYFALGALAHGVISYYLPGPYREAFQYVTILFSAGVVATNYGVGLKFAW